MKEQTDRNGHRNLNQVKSQIVRALSHSEAQDGLYFRNFAHLHEEDERDVVAAPEEDILEALKELIAEGRVTMDEESEEAIFSLN